MPRQAIRDPHQLSERDPATLGIRGGTVSCTAHLPAVRYPATRKRRALCTPLTPAPTFSPPTPMLSPSTPVADPTLRRTFTTLASPLGTLVDMVWWNRWATCPHFLAPAPPIPQTRRVTGEETAAMTAAAGSSTFLVARTPKTIPFSPHPVCSPTIRPTKT